MSAFIHNALVLVGTAALLLPAPSAAAEPGTGVAAAMPVVVIEPEGPAVSARPMPPHIARQQAPEGPFGMQALGPDRLASHRGAADVLNDMQLKGVVTNNQAVNVSTGNNTIADGSFAHTSGLPMVVQNSGNNVLIQNATIVNVQVK